MANTNLNERVLDGISLVTNSKTVKIDNANGFTLQDSLNVDISIQEIKNLFPQCKNFRGSWEWGELYETFFDDAKKGDFWINDKAEELKSYHCYLHRPNDAMYYDGENLVPLQLPRNKKQAEQYHYDICIVGGGAGGVACGYALRNLGLKVVLIEKLDSLGGTHTNGPIPVLISSPITGTWLHDVIKDGYEQERIGVSPSKEIGDNPELFERLWLGSMYTYSETNRGTQFTMPYYWTGQRYLKDLREGGIEVLLRTEFISSSCNPTNEKQVMSIKVKNLDNGAVYNIGAEYFVDCSADGVLCRYDKTEGEDFFIGTDPKSRFNEAGYTDGYEGNRYQINTVELGYRACEDSYYPADKMRQQNISKWKTFSDVTAKANGGGSFEGHQVHSTSTGNSIDPHIFIDLGNDVAHSYGVYRAKDHYRKTYGNTPTKAFAEPCKILGIRESYRIHCERMLTQTDCGVRASSSTIAQNHTIALSSWYADIHNDSDLQGSVTNSWLNEIPYETLIPKAFNNVLVGSRCFGCSHIAQSSYRLTKTMMSIGYACGKAMELCVNGWLDDVRNVDITALQQAVGIVELMNTMETYFNV